MAAASVTVKKSTFHAVAAPCATAAALPPLLAAVAAAHPTARHVAHAARLSPTAARSSDGGEPRGTGGAPLLAALDGARLVGVAVAVARVYGGVKLGVGGLGRAYGEAAAAAVAAGGRVPVVPRSRAASGGGGVMVVDVPDGVLGAFGVAVRDATRGAGRVVPVLEEGGGDDDQGC
ncbi:hypothetical protein I4F81_004394 [Pyropia yezoensis]|uniref:Uncharacterized protein n=1 Tax=Pyropia yezoensis TaxID=2788 RepID=A0ACC3BUU2_PYRYE|nr:hypothetical protein I4F81_004394 [Neopyropia yezoensis]